MAETDRSLLTITEGMQLLHDKDVQIVQYTTRSLRAIYGTIEEMRCAIEDKTSRLAWWTGFAFFRNEMMTMLDAVLEASTTGRLSPKILGAQDLRNAMALNPALKDSVAYRELSFVYQHAMLYPVKLSFEGLQFGYILRIPNPKEGDIFPMYKIFNAGFHKPAPMGQLRDPTVYLAPLPAYAILTRADGLAPLDVDNCNVAPGVLSCEIGAVARSKVYHPCLELLAAHSCIDCPLAHECAKEVGVARMEGHSARVITTPAGTLVRTFDKEVRVYSVSAHHAPGNPGRALPKSRYGTYWVSHSDHESISVGSARYPSQGQSVYVTRVIQPDPFNFTTLDSDLRRESRLGLIQEAPRTRALQDTIEAFQELQQAYQDIASQPITLATLDPSFFEQTLDSTGAHLSSWIVTATILFAIGIIVACFYYQVCYRVRRNQHTLWESLRSSGRDWREKVDHLYEILVNMDLELSTVYRRFSFAAFRSWFVTEMGERRENSARPGRVRPRVRWDSAREGGDSDTEGPLLRPRAASTADLHRAPTHPSLLELQGKQCSEPTSFPLLGPDGLPYGRTTAHIGICVNMLICSDDDYVTLLQKYERDSAICLSSYAATARPVLNRMGDAGIFGGAQVDSVACLLDTGSDVSMITKDVATRTKCMVRIPQDHPVTVRQTQGGAVNFFGFTKLVLVVKGHMYPHMFLIPNDNPNAPLNHTGIMLGNDFLDKLGELYVRYHRNQILLKDIYLNATYVFRLPRTAVGKPQVVLKDPTMKGRPFQVGTEMVGVPRRLPEPGEVHGEVPPPHATDVIRRQMDYQEAQNAGRIMAGVPMGQKGATAAAPRKPGRPGKKGRAGPATASQGTAPMAPPPQPAVTRSADADSAVGTAPSTTAPTISATSRAPGPTLTGLPAAMAGPSGTGGRTGRKVPRSKTTTPKSPTGTSTAVTRQAGVTYLAPTAAAVTTPTTSAPTPRPSTSIAPSATSDVTAVSGALPSPADLGITPPVDPLTGEDSDDDTPLAVRHQQMLDKAKQMSQQASDMATQCLEIEEALAGGMNIVFDDQYQKYWPHEYRMTNMLHLENPDEPPPPMGELVSDTDEVWEELGITPPPPGPLAELTTLHCTEILGDSPVEEVPPEEDPPKWFEAEDSLPPLSSLMANSPLAQEAAPQGYEDYGPLHLNGDAAAQEGNCDTSANEPTTSQDPHPELWADRPAGEMSESDCSTDELTESEGSVASEPLVVPKSLPSGPMHPAAGPMQQVIAPAAPNPGPIGPTGYPAHLFLFPLRLAHDTTVAPRTQRTVSVRWPNDQYVPIMDYAFDMIEDITQQTGLLGVCLILRPQANSTKDSVVVLNPTDRPVTLCRGITIGHVTPWPAF
jgi:hypothetical protein